MGDSGIEKTLLSFITLTAGNSKGSLNYLWRIYEAKVLVELEVDKAQHGDVELCER